MPDPCGKLNVLQRRNTLVPVKQEEYEHIRIWGKCQRSLPKKGRAPDVKDEDQKKAS